MPRAAVQSSPSSGASPTDTDARGFSVRFLAVCEPALRAKKIVVPSLTYNRSHACGSPLVDALASVISSWLARNSSADCAIASSGRDYGPRGNVAAERPSDDVAGRL